MSLLLDGIKEAVRMLFNGDYEVLYITWLTLRVCLTAISISVVIGVPAGIFLGLKRFYGRKILMIFVNLGMSLPPVVAGLIITMTLWRSGPLGQWEWLYTPQAIVMAQVLVSLPIIIGLTSTAFQQIDHKMLWLVKSMGANRIQKVMILLKQTKLAIVAAIMAGLGRVLAEVGAAMMVGGNLKGETRILTTSIVMEVSKGNFDIAIALSFILMTLAFIITYLLTTIQQRNQVS